MRNYAFLIKIFLSRLWRFVDFVLFFVIITSFLLSFLKVFLFTVFSTSLGLFSFAFIYFGQYSALQCAFKELSQGFLVILARYEIIFKLQEI